MNKSLSGSVPVRPMNISILGCGWLGLSLGKKLQSLGHVVKGSTTTADKKPLIASEGIRSFEISLGSSKIIGEIEEFLQEADALIICIPPGSSKTGSAFDLENAMGILIRKVVDLGVCQVVLISSVSVYKDTEEIPEYTEKAAPNHISGNAGVLRSVEKLFRDNLGSQTTIIRFGGLLGPDRHPVKHLSGRRQVANPLAPVNLIRQEDCIAIIQSILEKGVVGKTFNAVAPEHPGREEYYHQQALLRGIALPEFHHGTVSKGKVISSLELERLLGYRFRTSIWG